MVSVGFTTNNPFGEVIEKDIKYEPKKHKGLFNQLIKNTTLGTCKIENLTDETLHAHHIDHFT